MKIHIHIEADSLGDAVTQMHGAMQQVESMQQGDLFNGARQARAVEEAAVTTEVDAALASPAKTRRKKADAPAEAPAAEPLQGSSHDPLADEPAETMTLEQIRALLALLQTHHPEQSGAVVNIIKDHGKVARLSAADASTYPAMAKAAREWLHANGHPNA